GAQDPRSASPLRRRPADRPCRSDGPRPRHVPVVGGSEHAAVPQHARRPDRGRAGNLHGAVPQDRSRGPVAGAPDGLRLSEGDFRSFFAIYFDARTVRLKNRASNAGKGDAMGDSAAKADQHGGAKRSWAGKLAWPLLLVAGFAGGWVISGGGAG